MRNDPSASISIVPHDTPQVPGRPYAFVVVLLAAFMVGLTVFALQAGLATSESASLSPTAKTNIAQNQTRPSFTASPLNREHLQRLAGIALGVAILSLIPSRKPTAPKSSQLTPQLVSQSTGLPVLGSLFAGSTPGPSPQATRSSWLIRTMVSTSELILCTAFMMTLAACFTQPQLFAILRQNPLHGYVAAVAQLGNIVQSWVHPGVPLA